MPPLRDRPLPGLHRAKSLNRPSAKPPAHPSPEAWACVCIQSRECIPTGRHPRTAIKRQLVLRFGDVFQHDGHLQRTVVGLSIQLRQVTGGSLGRWTRRSTEARLESVCQRSGQDVHLFQPRHSTRNSSPSLLGVQRHHSLPPGGSSSFDFGRGSAGMVASSCGLGTIKREPLLSCRIGKVVNPRVEKHQRPLGDHLAPRQLCDM